MSSTRPATTAATLSLAWLCSSLSLPTKAKGVGAQEGYPQYCIAKNKIQLTPDINVDAILEAVEKKYANEKVTTIDGVKIDFPEYWVHLRKSNTEPIIRIYSEAKTMEQANAIAQEIKTWFLRLQANLANIQRLTPQSPLPPRNGLFYAPPHN